ncbi:MAG TPA: SRPBCC domain-containing protein [Methanolinea sp.]|nr:SRPBCC domain-containing protein [Methanolinea sp.]HQK55825.1 SRPBCC domain-containing protein [Methanolinea sp.]
MRIIRSEIRINAPDDVVWKALLASDAIPPEIGNAVHDMRIRQPFRVVMNSEGRNITLTVTILAINPSRHMRWKGYLWAPGLFTGEHSFDIIEESRECSLLIQQETFSGILVPFLSRTIDQTEEQFGEANAAVKTLAEQEYARSKP